jgi:Ca2+:H+ antiporter
VSGWERLFLGATAGITAVAGVLRYSGAGAVPAFTAATLALAGLAWVVALATEQVGLRFGPGVTGFLQSTFGNLPEFFIVLFALGSGELVVAQTSLIGSIFANALLVRGLDPVRVRRPPRLHLRPFVERGTRSRFNLERPASAGRSHVGPQ